MAVFTTIAFATFFLENDHFVTFNKRSEHFTNHFGAINCRGAYRYSTIGISEENTVEFNGVAFFSGFSEIMNIQELVGFSLKLLSLNFYNCVHCCN